jgi:EAL domain-containing protein (putative c-di-GMP-specific phosphodiesterase class I)
MAAPDPWHGLSRRIYPHCRREWLHRSDRGVGLEQGMPRSGPLAGSLRVAVNLSSVQFRTGNLVETVAGALAASGLAASRLELEITESTVMQDADATLAIIKEIKALGVRLAMDDFGTGYSSLAYLQRFPFDKVKIDRAFVRDSGQTTNLAIIRAVTSIAESMAIETTAEGVETEEQFACVANEGCTEVQGFLFSPPRPGSEILAMMAQQSRPAAAGVERVRDVAIV